MATKPRPIVDLDASCACGGATLHFAGTVLSMFLCACEDCQRATGTGHSSVILANRVHVTVVGPLKSFDRPANSGATFTRSFCPGCGTLLYGRSSRVPDILMLPVGLFGRAADWFVPNQLIFARSHRDWDVVAADLPKYQTYRNEGEFP